MPQDEDALDEMLLDYVGSVGSDTPTSDRVLEAALAADAAELINSLQHVLSMLSHGNTLTDPVTRANLVQTLGRMRHFLGGADRLLQMTGSGMYRKPQGKTG